MVFKKLVRFVSGNEACYGDLLNITGDTYTVMRLIGSPFGELKATGDIVQVKKLLTPIESTPNIICVGLNYKQHAAEANLPVPKYPPTFTKPADALEGPEETISVHPDARQMLDYEGELTVVIGRDVKDVSEENALEFVLGFTAGNDLSARNFKIPEASGGQFGYSKSFDKFAPIGHTIVAVQEIADPQNLRLITSVNGKVKQETSTNDMIWSVKQIISHLSRGTTLRKGTVIMTGTPSGVGFFRREFLDHGDVVEVEIEGVASVKNRIDFCTYTC
ncbi:hypothetical protein DTO021C3_2815 [Paecilomyces variotii]|nr:hypothetical protein DTO021C3_2815 [Paecilomyces variotii]